MGNIRVGLVLRLAAFFHHRSMQLLSVPCMNQRLDIYILYLLINYPSGSRGLGSVQGFRGFRGYVGPGPRTVSLGLGPGTLGIECPRV